MNETEPVDLLPQPLRHDCVRSEEQDSGDQNINTISAHCISQSPIITIRYTLHILT